MNSQPLFKVENTVRFWALIIVIFLIIFFLLLQKGDLINPELTKPIIAGFVAFLIVLPPLLPSFMVFLKDHLSGVKISLTSIELQFDQLKTDEYSSKSINEAYSSLVESYHTNIEYNEVMTSHSLKIIEAVKEVENKGNEIFRIYLDTGKIWVPQNLYLLNLLLLRLTDVQLVIFTENRKDGVPDEFVGMSSPGEIVRGLVERCPDYGEASKGLILQDLDIEMTHKYFESLNRQSDIHKKNLLWLDSTKLKRVLGPYLHWDKIESKEYLGEHDFRYILETSYPYVAVVKERQYKMAINRDKFATKFARKLFKIS